MSQELLYTSAAHGLKSGSRGFCTVLSTQGMPAPLATGLEALSGYRPIYPTSDSRANLNPVVQSHVILPVAGRSWHVLSRIADYGLDYSQRTNKLAHHVVLDQVELTENGPAHLIGSPAFMRTEWDEQVKLVPPKPVKKIPAISPGVCRAWKELTGDAGWAGVLAESFMRDPERPVFLLFEPGQDLLPLIAEAISLLPIDARWNVTFSTYFTGLPQGVTCAWRCILKGSPEAHQSLRFPKALRIDLTCTLPIPAAGDLLVEAARTGKAPQLDSMAGAAPEEGTEPDNTVDVEASASADAPENSDNLLSGPLPPKRPLPPVSTGSPYPLANKPQPNRPGSKRTLAEVEEQLNRSNHNIRLTIAIVTAVLLVFAVGVGLIWSYFPRSVLKSREIAVRVAQNPISPLNDKNNNPSPPVTTIAENQHQPSPPKAPQGGSTTGEATKQSPEAHDSSSGQKAKEPATKVDKVESDKVASIPESDATPARAAAAPPPTSVVIDSPIALNSQKGKTTELSKINSATDPYADLVLWSPPEMFLELHSKSKGKPPSLASYAVNESNGGPLAKLESTIVPLEDLDGLKKFELKITSVGTEQKVKRLNWCELEIPAVPTRTIRFHKDPKKLSDLENKFEEDPKEFGRFHLQWPLGIEADEANVPHIRVDRLTLSFDETDFDVDPVADQIASSSGKTLTLKTATLNDHLKKEMPASAVPLVEPLCVRLTTSFSKSNEGRDPSVTLLLTITGLDKTAKTFTEHQRAQVVATIKRVNANLATPLAIKTPPIKMEISAQANAVISEIDKVLSTLDNLNREQKTKTPETLVASINTERTSLKTVEADYIKMQRLIERVASCSVKTAALYYDVVGSANGPSRKIYVITESP